MIRDIRDKNTFIMKKEWSPLILSLSREDAGALIKNIYLYQTGKQPIQLKESVDAIFEMIKISFDKDNKEQTWQIKNTTG